MKKELLIIAMMLALSSCASIDTQKHSQNDAKATTTQDIWPTDDDDDW